MFTTHFGRGQRGLLGFIQVKNYMFNKVCLVTGRVLRHTCGARLFAYIFGGLLGRRYNNYFTIYTHCTSGLGLLNKVSRGIYTSFEVCNSYIFGGGLIFGARVILTGRYHHTIFGRVHNGKVTIGNIALCTGGRQT